MSLLALWPAIPAFLIAAALHWLDVAYIVEPRHKAELEAQQTALIDQCNAAKKLTEEASNEYQKNLSNLDKQLATLRMRKPARCVPVARVAGGPHDHAEPTKLLGPYGLSSEWAFEYAGDAEKTRLQLIGLQDFIKKVWNNN